MARIKDIVRNQNFAIKNNITTFDNKEYRNISNFLYATQERHEIPIDLIVPNPFNVNIMSNKEFEELKNSIKITNGKYLRDNPILVMPYNDKYMIIDGEHRYKACRDLGYDKIPVEIKKDIDISEAKILNVIYSKNRGKIDYFNLSKLLNEEYKDVSGKTMCTQQDLANRFGFNISRIKNIIPIYPRLKNLLKSSHANFFSNRQLEELSRVRNDFLREKLILQAIEKSYSSEEIRSQSTKFNKILKYLSKEVESSYKIKCVLDLFTGESLFKYDFKYLQEKIYQLIIENSRAKIIFKHIKDFILHTNLAKEFHKKYVRENNTWKGWVSFYYQNSISEPSKKMARDFFYEYYESKVKCHYCGKDLSNNKKYPPHHEEYNVDYFWFIFPDAEQIIFPCCYKCHQKGLSKNWKKGG